ncbi:hypothetical protein PIIN_10867, partial [Serendipita indica DSM 11827]
HDIYIESVNLAIGYTLPFVLGPHPNNNNQPFNVKPVMQCQGRSLADAFNETSTNKNNPAFDTSVDVARRRSNLGYAAAHPSGDAVSVTRTYVSPPHSTQTQTPTGTAVLVPSWCLLDFACDERGYIMDIYAAIIYTDSSGLSIDIYEHDTLPEQQCMVTLWKCN